MTDNELWLHTLLQKNGIPITAIQLSRCSQYHALLRDWNSKINLVSRKNEENLWKGHIALSLTMLCKVSFRPGSRILDLGTGGGFPGIPLAILLPDCSFTLLDSTQKKINAVQSMAADLGLTNVKTIWGRAEEVNAQPTMYRSFDAVVARSVSALSNLLEWGMPFLKASASTNVAGEKTLIAAPSLVTFKGREIAEEEAEAKRRFPKVHLASIPLVHPGSEVFDDLEKKLIIATAN